MERAPVASAVVEARYRLHSQYPEAHNPPDNPYVLLTVTAENAHVTVGVVTQGWQGVRASARTLLADTGWVCETGYRWWAEGTALAVWRRPDRQMGESDASGGDDAGCGSGEEAACGRDARAGAWREGSGAGDIEEAPAVCLADGHSVIVIAICGWMRHDDIARRPGRIHDADWIGDQNHNTDRNGDWNGDRDNPCAEACVRHPDGKRIHERDHWQ